MILGGDPESKTLWFSIKVPQGSSTNPKVSSKPRLSYYLTLSGKRKKSAASSISVEKTILKETIRDGISSLGHFFFFAFGNSVLERSADSASPGKKRDFCRGGPSKTESGFGLKWESFSRKQRLYV